METAKIESITRVKNTNNYVIQLDKELKIYNYIKNKYESKSHFKLKLKAYSNQQDFKKIFSSLANFFRLTAPTYRNNLKASLASYIDYFKLLDSNNQFSFNSLVGKKVSVFKRGWCISYDSLKKEFTKGADGDMISLLLNNNDEMNLKYKIKKYNEDKTVKRKYDKVILKAFTDFCKIEAKEKNDEKDIARDNLDVQITKLLLTDAEKLVDLKLQINDLSKNQLFNIITSVAKGIVQKQKEDNEKLSSELAEVREDNEKLTNEVTKVKEGYNELLKDNKKLSNEVTKVKEGYKKLFKNFKELKESNKKLSNEVTIVKESYNEIRENNNKLINEVTIVKESNKKLSNELKEVKESNKKLSNEVTRVKESNKKLSNEVTIVKENNKKLSNELKEVREGYNKLIKYNDKLFEKYNELKSYSKKKIKELEEKYNGLAESYSDLYREVNELKSDNKELRECYADIKLKNKKLSIKVNGLVENYHELKSLIKRKIK